MNLTPQPPLQPGEGEQPPTLREAMEYRYRLYERDYQLAKRERMDNIVLWALTVMNEIQRILRLAGLPEIEERE